MYTFQGSQHTDSPLHAHHTDRESNDRTTLSYALFTFAAYVLAVLCTMTAAAGYMSPAPFMFSCAQHLCENFCIRQH